MCSLHQTFNRKRLHCNTAQKLVFSPLIGREAYKHAGCLQTLNAVCVCVCVSKTENTLFLLVCTTENGMTWLADHVNNNFKSRPLFHVSMQELDRVLCH